MDKWHVKTHERTLKKYIDTLDELGFEYLGGYESNKSPMIIKCKECGTIRTVTGDYIGRAEKVGRYTNIKCIPCEKKKTEAEHEAKQREKERQRQREKEHRAMAVKEVIAFVYNECRECGQPFFSTKETSYCSDRCIRRHNNRVHYENREVRLRKARIDTDISLEKVYLKDKGVCYLCGKQCDWNDYVMVGETFVAGNNYPSIEHVVPLSKDGEHSWSNVRLAHRICNTLKGNTYISPSHAKIDD